MQGFLDRTSELVAHLNSIPSLEPNLQKLVAELILIRVFDDFQNTVADMCARLVCGGLYVDGSQQTLLTARARSSATALDLMQTYGRSLAPGKVHRLNWSKASYIMDAIRYTVDGSDRVHVVIGNHGAIIEEMRRVRVRIAHNNASSRMNFRDVVKVRYGAEHNQISPGILLLTPRFSPILIREYIASARTIVRTSCGA